MSNSMYARVNTGSCCRGHRGGSLVQSSKEFPQRDGVGGVMAPVFAVLLAAKLDVSSHRQRGG